MVLCSVLHSRIVFPGDSFVQCVPSARSQRGRVLTLQNNSGRKQALTVRGVKLRKSEQTSRKKQPVRAAAAEGGSIVCGCARRMPRDESICTHDRASANERLREYGCSVDAAQK